MILAISNAHERPDLLQEQLLNYYHCCNGNVYQIVHINKAFQAEFYNHAAKLGIDFNKLKNVTIFSRHVTRWGSVFHGMLASVIEAQNLNIKFEHILFHTNADLLVKRDLDLHVKKYDIGCVEPHPLAEVDFWYKKIIANKRTQAFLDVLGQSELLRGRAEGCFFRKDIFYELIFPLVAQYDLLNDELTPDYPCEEVELMNAVQFFCERHKVRRTRHLIHTSLREHQHSNMDDIEFVLKQSNIYGLKRFSNKIDDPIRLKLRDSLGMS